MNRYIFLASLVLVTRVMAQTDAVLPPTPPFVQFPSPDMAFTIMVNDGEEVATKPASATVQVRNKKLLQVDVVQVGKLRCDTLTWDDNSQTETWLVGRYGLVQSTMGDWVNLIDPVRDPEAKGNMLRRDASDFFSWLKSAHYVGIVSFKSKLCYQFRSGEAEADPLLGKDEKTAWIEVKTKLPVALKIGEQTFSYVFHDPPTQPLVLPPKFKALADRYQLLGPSPAATTH